MIPLDEKRIGFNPWMPYAEDKEYQLKEDKILVVVSRSELLTAASIGIRAFLSSIKSPKELSSSSPTGVSKLIGSFAIFNTFFTF